MAGCADVGSLGGPPPRRIVGKIYRQQPHLAFWPVLPYRDCAICSMLTKIELTEAGDGKTSALKVSHALELAKTGQF